MKFLRMVNKKKEQTICVEYHSTRVLNNKCKLFKWNQKKEACDFALSIEDDKYIDMCTYELVQWIHETGHPISKKKFWDFC